MTTKRHITLHQLVQLVARRIAAGTHASRRTRAHGLPTGYQGRHARKNATQDAAFCRDTYLADYDRD